MNHMTVEELTARIEDFASYDGQPDARCPHCGEILHYGWVHFDHRDALAANITRTLGLGKIIQEIVYQRLNRWSFSNESEPHDRAEQAARDILKTLFDDLA